MSVTASKINLVSTDTAQWSGDDQIPRNVTADVPPATATTRGSMLIAGDVGRGTGDHAVVTGMQTVPISEDAPLGGQVPSYDDTLADEFGNGGIIRWTDLLGGVDARTGTTETIAQASRGMLVTFDNASAQAVTLDAAIRDRFLCAIDPLGVGTVTLTPGTGTINGASSLALTGAGWLLFDGTNWRFFGGGSGGGGTWGSITGTLSSQTDLQSALDAKLDDSQLDTDGTLAANSDSKIASQKATKTYADTKIAISFLDTDGTLAANSDSKIATQKATKTYADTKATKAAVQQESYNYAADTGSANTYAISLSPTPSLVAGSRVIFKAANANSGASTLNVNSGGAVAIKKNGSSALAAGDIVANQIVSLIYDGTNWQMVAGAVGPAGVAGSGAMSIGLLASLPVTIPTAGTAYACTDADIIYISDGTKWIPYGQIHGRSAIDPSAFTFFTTNSSHQFVFNTKGTTTLFADDAIANTGDSIYRPNATNLPGSGMFRAKVLVRLSRKIAAGDSRIGIFMEDVTATKSVSMSISPSQFYYLYWNAITTLTFNSIKINNPGAITNPAVFGIAPLWLAFLYVPSATGSLTAGIYCQYSLDNKLWNNFNLPTANVNDWMPNRPTRFGIYLGTWTASTTNGVEVLSLEIDQGSISNDYESI